ncbi:MAG: rhodanese-like domain-containing protein [Chloroflexi bacterium]|nr:rhodanese-like domain-containing protein [Chloroflexota bacterium]
MRWIFAVCLCLLAACSPNPASAPEPAIVRVAGGAYKNVSPAQLKQMLAAKDFFFVNVHIPYEGEIAPTDAFVDYDRIAENIGKLPADPNAKIFLYCRSGRMSAIAAEILIQRGYTHIWNLDGGMVAWESAGLPIVQKPR